MTRVDRALQSLCSRSQTPGAAVTIRREDSAATFVAGQARLPASPVTDEVVFALSSITKPFTAALVATLVQQGRLAYEDLVIDRLADFSLAGGEGRSITVGHLVTHTGGFEGPDGATAGRAGRSVTEFVASLGAFSPYAPPGAMFGYSSAGYVVLAAVIERVTGLDYLEALRQNVLIPLGLDVRDGRGFPPAKIAVGYDVRAGRVADPVPSYPPALDAAGGLWATSDTVARFGQSFTDHSIASNPTPFLDRAVLADARRPLVVRPEGAAEQLAQGLIWRHQSWDGEPLLWHTGGSAGHASKLTVVPRHGLVIATATNAQLNVGHQVTGPLEEWLLYHLVGIERPDPLAPTPPVLPLAAYEGDYWRHTRTLHVSIGDGHLQLTSVPTVYAHPQLRQLERTLTSLGGHLFRDENGTTYCFALDDSDRPSHVVSKGWVARRSADSEGRTESHSLSST